MVLSQNSSGLVRDLNPGPLAPKARIIPLDQRATISLLPVLKLIILQLPASLLKFVDCSSSMQYQISIPSHFQRYLMHSYVRDRPAMANHLDHLLHQWNVRCLSATLQTPPPCHVSANYDAEERGKILGLVRDLNPGPRAPEARIIPLDQRAHACHCTDSRL